MRIKQHKDHRVKRNKSQDRRKVSEPMKFDAGEVSIRIVKSINFKLTHRSRVPGLRNRNQKFSSHHQYIKQSDLFQHTIKFYQNHLNSDNTRIKLDVVNYTISKEQLIECLTIYFLGVFNGIEKNSFIHRKILLNKQNPTFDTLYNLIKTTRSSHSKYIVKKNILVWNTIVHHTRMALKVEEYRNHANIYRRLPNRDNPISDKFRRRTLSRSYQGLYEKNENENFVIYPLLYATSRNQIKDDTNRTIDYGNERSKDLHFGECQVKVDKHPKLGIDNNTSIIRLIGSVIGKNNRNVKFEFLEEHNKRSFIESLNFLYSAATENEMLLYIHGYKNSFQVAAERAAQIAYDIRFPGVTSFFSWASADEVTGYFADEATIEISAKHLYKYILNISQTKETKKIMLK